MENIVVGVAGAGVMGTGLAQNLAATKHRVILVDRTDDILEQSKRNIENSIRFHD